METIKPKIIITYAKRNVTADFLPVLVCLSYTDKLTGTASELAIDVDNRKGYFFNDWYPAIGDEISVQVGYEGAPLLDTGLFYVDEASLAGGNPDSCSIRGLSLQTSALCSAVEKKRRSGSVSSIVKEIAGTLSMSATGDLSGSWSGLQREPGLQFLCRIAKETGRICKVEGKKVVFYRIADLIQTAQVNIKKGDVISYDIKDKAAGRYKKCTVKYYDPKQKKTLEGSAVAEVEGGQITVWEEVADVAAATTRAKEILTTKNKTGVEISVTLAGDPRLQAGVSVSLSGFGRFDSIYFIDQARHALSVTGYTTEVKLQKNEVK